MTSFRMMEEDQLKALFRAFRDRDEAAFQRSAEAIISDQLAANRHGVAAELRNALNRPAAQQVLRHLPRDRRGGEDLLFMTESDVDATRIVLKRDVQKKVDQILAEHRNEYELARHGLAAKRKLLFWGPPGSGKTFCAYFVAHELGLPIAVIRLHSVISSFLGDTATNLQRVFDVAASRPMVLLFDEVDAVGKKRDDSNDVGELKRVVNSLLQAIDSYRGRSILIAATNHQYLLDPALWRRFDDVVEFSLPGTAERLRYFKTALSGVRVNGSLQSLAEKATGCSYDDLRRAAAESMKLMILGARKSIATAEVMNQIEEIRKRNRAALRPRSK